jgi:hypothetical protein
MGWRTTAQNLNLNRDYVKADAPEMRALLTLLKVWPVDLYLDIHVTDGLDYQYDITYAYHGRAGCPSWSPRIGEWLDRSYSPAPGIGRSLLEGGHRGGPGAARRPGDAHVDRWRNPARDGFSGRGFAVRLGLLQ